MTTTAFRMISLSRWCGTAATLLLLCACGGSPTTPSSPPGSGGGVTSVLVGAGDIGMCGSSGPEATARLLDGIPGTVFTAGDNAYTQGTAQQFRDCYDPSWGRHRSRTHPSPGNHDYESPGAEPYFAYFGLNAGPAGLGYYSFTVGDWHIVSMNSLISVSPGSPQQTWLQADLAANAVACVAAIFHHPLFTSGPNGAKAAVRDLWRTLYGAGVDIIVNGDNHMYERFAPQTPDGAADARRGIREFVVGTGGATLYQFTHPQPNLEASLSSFGVLKLTLRPGAYDWQFLGAGGGVGDAGSDMCR